MRTFGTDISFSKRNKIRMLESFETKEECRKRTISDIEKIATGKKSKKGPCRYKHILGPRNLCKLGRIIPRWISN